MESRYVTPGLAAEISATPLWSSNAVSTTLKLGLEAPGLMFTGASDRFTVGLSGGIGFTTIGSRSRTRLICTHTYADDCNMGLAMSAGFPVSYIFFEDYSIGVGAYTKPQIELLVMNDPVIGARLNWSVGLDLRAGVMPSGNGRHTHVTSIIIGFQLSYPLSVKIQDDLSFGLVFGFRLLLP